MPNYGRPLTFRGRTMPLYKWAEEVGLHPCTLTRRLDKGWSVVQALTTPPRGEWSRLRRDQNKRCTACRYGRRLNRWTTEFFCAHILLTGRKRPCSFADCKGWKPDKTTRRKSTCG